MTTPPCWHRSPPRGDPRAPSSSDDAQRSVRMAACVWVLHHAHVRTRRAVAAIASSAAAALALGIVTVAAAVPAPSPVRPGALAVGRDGVLYVADQARHQILAMTAPGRFRV